MTNKNRIGIVIGREFNTRVRKRSFIVVTLLVPILMIAFISLPIILGMYSVGKEKIAVVDRTGNHYADILPDNRNYSFVATENDPEELRKMGAENKEGFTGVLVIDEDLTVNPKAVGLYSFKQMPEGLTAYVNEKLSQYVSDCKLKAYQTEDIDRIVADSRFRLSVPTYRWNESGETQRSSGAMAGIIGMALAFISFYFISAFGGSVMNGVLEEKKNRIMEVMVSSVKPFDLMAGKIIGIGLVGLVQMLLWIAFGALLIFILMMVMIGSAVDLSSLTNMTQADVTGMAANMGADSFRDMQDSIRVLSSVNFPQMILMFVLYFVGGYLLYASLYAAVGASVSSDEDSAQFMMPVMLLLMFSFYAGFGSINNPEGPLALWCSYIPFTSPIVMLVRIPFGVPIWQQALSVFILYASAWLIVWLSARIYRVGILMYGKKPSLKEIGRWLSYK